MIEINTNSEIPIADQIVSQYRLAIITGKLLEGDKLPSVRELAFQLSVNSKTVVRAYAKLTESGLVIAHKGKGLFVETTTNTNEKAEQSQVLDNALDKLVNEVAGLDFSIAEISERLAEKMAKIYQTQAGKQDD